MKFLREKKLFLLQILINSIMFDNILLLKQSHG